MNEKTRSMIWSIAFILIGMALGLVIMPSFYYSANQMIESCNQAFGAENWKVVKSDKQWVCTPLHIEYYPDIEIPCLKNGSCNASELLTKYTIDTTNTNLTIVSRIP